MTFATKDSLKKELDSNDFLITLSLNFSCPKSYYRPSIHKRDQPKLIQSQRSPEKRYGGQLDVNVGIYTYKENPKNDDVYNFQYKRDAETQKQLWHNPKNDDVYNFQYKRDAETRKQLWHNFPIQILFRTANKVQEIDKDQFHHTNNILLNRPGNLSRHPRATFAGISKHNVD